MQSLGTAGRSARLAVVVGCGRSGTHWLGKVLDSHPDVTVAFEDPDTFPLIKRMALDGSTRAELMPQLLDAYHRKCAGTGTSWFVDKSHPALWMTAEIAQAFPDVVFLGIQRDPFETVASMIRHRFVSAWTARWREFPLPNEFLGITQQGVPGYAGYSLPKKHALRWRSHADRMAELSQAGVVSTVSYSTLRAAPAEVTGQLAAWLGVADVFEPVRTDRADSPDWWDILSDRDVREIAEVAGVDCPQRPGGGRRATLHRWLTGRRFSSR